MTSDSNPFYIKLSHSLLAILLIIVFMYLGQSILIPLSFAGLLAIILIGPCDYLENKGVPRGIAAVASLLIALTIGIVIMYFISSQIISFRNDLPILASQLSTALIELEDWARLKFHISSGNMRQFINSASSQTLSHTSTLIGSTFSTISNTFIYLVLIPIYTFLLLLYRKLVVHFFIASFSEHHTERVKDILAKTRRVIKGYIVGLFIEMLIVAAMNCIGFFILGVKYALLLGVIAALLNLIPYLGIFTACLLSMLITFTTATPSTVLGVAVVLIIVHIIDSNILLPKVVGSKVKINALVTILGVILGSTIWGIPGMFLAIPIIAILKVIFDGVDSLNPWGMLLGDDAAAVRQRPVKSTWQNTFKRKGTKNKSTP